MKKTILLLTFIPTLCFGQWVQIGSDIDGEAAGDACGYSTAISSNGTILAIGANGNQSNGSGSGHVRIFENINGTWSQIGSDIDGDYGDQTGHSVSISDDGSVVAVGEPISAINSSFSGQVRVFRNVNNVWTQIGNSINGDSTYWLTGNRGTISLSADGSILAVGSRGADVAGIGLSVGKVRIYENQSDNWVQMGSDINGDAINQFFGSSVSLSSDGSIVAVGALGDFFDEGTGHVSVFENIAGVWTQMGSNINATPVGVLVDAVSLSADGSIVAIGMPSGDTSGNGLAQVFENINGVWTQIGNNLIGEAVGDFFGYSVSLSDSGNVLAVGATRNDAIGLNSGRSYVFQNIAGNWVQVDNAIDGEAAGGQLGHSVFLSSDGSILATGAPGNNHVRVLENTSILGVEAVENDGLLNVFPNPTNGLINIETNFNSFSDVKLYDLTGRLIFQNSYKESSFSIDLNSPSGVYLLHISNDKNDYNRKIIVE